MSRILVIEDNTDLAFGLRNNLEIEGFEVSVAADGERGLSLARDISQDLIILDLMLPKLDGYRLLKELRAEGSTIPILILTARGEEADKVRGLKLGADDYVTKPFGVMELIARVEALLRRAATNGQRDGGQIVAFGSISIDRSTRAVQRDGDSVALTPKEFELLLTLYDRNGAVASRIDLLREVWGYNSNVMSRTVDTHIAELRRKLELNPGRPRHILTVRKVGYRLNAS